MQKRREWLIRTLMILFGITVAIIIALPLLANITVTGREAYIDTDLGIVEYTVGDGDIFGLQYGTIAPPPNPDEVLSRHTLAWDSNGFRVPANPSDTYSIIALGDSYTEASGVAMPWSDVLAEQIGQSVRNLGYRGYGPQEYAIVMQEYGVSENPEVIVLGFFGGNDINNASSYAERADDFVLPELARDTLTQLTANNDPWDSERDAYQYPVYLDLPTGQIPVAFLNSYVSWINITQEDLRESNSLQAIRNSWRTIATLAGQDTCFVISYFPSKPQIYLPYVQQADRIRIIDGQVQQVTSPNGEIDDVDIEPTYDDLLSRIPNTQTVLAEVAASENIHFLDLTPAFEQAASEGEMLWLAYDSHWNQAGHDLAAAEIAEYIGQNCS